MTTTGRPSRDVLAVGPATGGVAYVFGHVVDHLGATSTVVAWCPSSWSASRS